MDGFRLTPPEGQASIDDFRGFVGPELFVDTSFNEVPTSVENHNAEPAFFPAPATVRRLSSRLIRDFNKTTFSESISSSSQSREILRPELHEMVFVTINCNITYNYII